MTAAAPRIVVAGHLCLDIRPALPRGLPAGTSAGPARWSVAPGALVDIGPATVSAGGCVGNTGMALHRLGVSARLIGKTGEDLFGNALADLFGGKHSVFAAGLIRKPEDHTSYTVIIEPPGLDRAFLHYPGANATFRAGDVDLSAAGGGPSAGDRSDPRISDPRVSDPRVSDPRVSDPRVSDPRIFHFGYPPVMPAMCADRGAELVTLFAGARRHGMVTSLDMTEVDPNGPTGRLDWPALLRNVLPHVDLFCPSLPELLFMIDRPKFDALKTDPDEAARALRAWLETASRRCLDWGAGTVVIKLGGDGLYLHGGAGARLERWAGAVCYHPCFEVTVKGTTGSGDSTVAGLLVAATSGLSAAEAVRLATAVGAYSVAGTDATCAIPKLERVRERIAAGWPTRAPARGLEDLMQLESGNPRGSGKPVFSP